MAGAGRRPAGARAALGGVAREVLEHEAAEERVVLPAAEQAAGADPLDQVRPSRQALRDRVGRCDAIGVDEVDPQDMADALALASGHLRASTAPSSRCSSGSARTSARGSARSCVR
jgi:hypothetical protein